MNGTCLGQQYEEGDHQLSKMPLNKFIPDPSKIYPEQPMNKNDILNHDMNNIRYQVATTDESDELDVATSDSSEADILWQLNVPKTTSIPTLKGSTLKTSTLKTTTPKQAKQPERYNILISYFFWCYMKLGNLILNLRLFFSRFFNGRSSIPQPSARRQSTGTVSAMPKNARRPVSGDGRRKTGKTKLEKR